MPQKIDNTCLSTYDRTKTITMTTKTATYRTNAEADVLVNLVKFKTATATARSLMTHAQQRAELFAGKTEPIPTRSSDDFKRYHIYVKVGTGSEKKQFTSFTLEEARAIIMYERDENDDGPVSKSPSHLWGDYATLFTWTVKDTKNNIVYTYNTTTRTLVPSIV